MFLLVTPIIMLETIQKLRNETNFESYLTTTNPYLAGSNGSAYLVNGSNITVGVETAVKSPQYWALTLLIIPFLTICGNGLVILSVWKFRNLHTAINFLIMGLAIADMMIALAVVPFGVYVEVNNGDWHLGIMLCEIYSAIDVACSTASIMTLTLISFDRYRAVKKPIEYSKQTHNMKRVFFLLGAVWAVSITVAMPILAGINQGYEKETAPKNICRISHADFLIWSSVISFGIPLATLLFVYTRILIEIRKRTRMSKLRKAGYSDVKPTESKFEASTNNPSCRGSIENDPLLSAQSGYSRSLGVRNNANFTSCSDLDSHQKRVSAILSPEHHCGRRRKSSVKSQSMNIIVNPGVLESCQSNVAVDGGCQLTSLTNDQTEGIVINVKARPGSNHSSSEKKIPNGHATSPKKLPNSPRKTRNVSATDDQLFVVIATVRPIKSPKKKCKQPFSDIDEIKYIDDKSSGGPSPVRKPCIGTDRFSKDMTTSHGSSPAKSSRSKSSEDDVTLPDGVSIRSIYDSTELPIPITESTSMPTGSSLLMTDGQSKDFWPPQHNSIQIAADLKNIEPKTPDINSEHISELKNICFSPSENRANLVVSADTFSAVDTLDTKRIPRNSLRLSRTTISDSVQNLTSYGSCSDLGTSNSYNSLEERCVDKLHSTRSSLQEKRRKSVKLEKKNEVPTQKKSLREILQRASTSRSRLESESQPGDQGTSEKSRGDRRKNSQKKRMSRAQKKERKATKTLGIVVGVFLVCWVPFFTLNFMNAICLKYKELQCTVSFLPFFLTTWLGYLNSCFNPLIYTTFNVDFRRAFKQLLCPWHSAPGRSRRI